MIDEHLDGEFATVVIAVHDPRVGHAHLRQRRAPGADRGRPARPEPVLAASSPPIGPGHAHRRAPDDAAAAARVGRLPLHRRAGRGPHRRRHPRAARGWPTSWPSLGRDATAAGLLDAVAAEARLVTDDMATIVLSPTARAHRRAASAREQLEVEPAEVDERPGGRFLEACGVAARRARARDRRGAAARRSGYGGARARRALRRRAARASRSLPRNVRSLEARVARTRRGAAREL